jgi:hypothetical protein
MARKPSDESRRARAAKLSIALGFAVTPRMVQVWDEKDYPRDDIKALRKILRNQERTPAHPSLLRDPLDEPEDTDDDGQEDAPGALEIEEELKTLQRELIGAEELKDAQRIRVQIAGVGDVLKQLRAQGHYVLKSDEERAAIQYATAVKSMILKIPSELPQQLIGLDYADAVLKCEDYAYSILLSLSKIEENQE